MGNTNYITVPIAAGRYGFSQYQIHALVVNKKLKYKIFNKQVMIQEESLNRFEKKTSNSGRIYATAHYWRFSFYPFLGVRSR